MLPDKIQLEIVTPDRLVVSEQVDEVMMPGALGYLGVLPGHAPLLTQIGIGVIEYRTGRERHYLAVADGFAEILRDSVSILADKCEKAEEIDLDRAQDAKQRAEQLLRESSEAAFARAKVNLERAVTRIQVHGRARG